MKTFLVEYSAGFGGYMHNHSGFGPTIYTQERVSYTSDKDYFDFEEFFAKYFNQGDTYFQIKLLEPRELSDLERQSYERYVALRDDMVQKAKQNDEQIDLDW